MKPWWYVSVGPGWENRLDEKVEEIIRERTALLADALKLYTSLDDARRAGCKVTVADAAECYQAGVEALAKTRGDLT